MNNPLGVSPSKGNHGKKKYFDLGENRTHDLRIRSTDQLSLFALILSENKLISHKKYSTRTRMKMRDEGDKFLEKLWCCVGGSITR